MTLKVGVLGYRFMGKAHANAMARLPMFFPEAPDVERHVLVGRDEEALADAADRLGFENTATDWEDVVDEVDAFYNLGPNHVHAEPSIAALEAGTPVLSEKPLANDLESAERMAEAAEDAGVPTATAFNYRFVPALRYAKNLIEEGEIGDIHHFRGRYLQDWLVDPEAPWSWRNSEEMAGSGALGDLGAHTIDLAVLGWEHTFVHENYEFLSAVDSAASETPREGGGETAGRGDYRPNFADGLAVQRALAAIQESDERGEWVAVE